MENKYYLITGMALANIQFSSGRWYKANSQFRKERISDAQLKKYQRFLHIEEKEECINGQATYATKSYEKQTKPTTAEKVENVVVNDTVVKEPKVEEPNNDIFG